MRQRWWIAVVAVIGIALAVVLFPKPDTGADVPPIDPNNRDPLNFGVDREPGQAAAPRPTRARDPDRVQTGPKPGTEALMASRNRPEVVYAAKIIAPWSAIRYVLLKVGTPEARALADELGDGLMADLRSVRTSEDAEGVWQTVEPKMAETAAKVAASEWGTDETIVKSLDRYKLLLGEFHAAKAGGGAAPTEGETPSADGHPAGSPRPAEPVEPAPTETEPETPPGKE